MDMLKEAERYMTETEEEVEVSSPVRKESVTVTLGPDTNPTTWEEVIQPVIDEVNAYADPSTNMGDLLYSEKTVDLLNQFLDSFNADHSDNAEEYAEEEDED